jgi:hypothetical protein
LASGEQVELVDEPVETAGVAAVDHGDDTDGVGGHSVSDGAEDLIGIGGRYRSDHDPPDLLVVILFTGQHRRPRHDPDHAVGVVEYGVEALAAFGDPSLSVW